MAKSTELTFNEPPPPQAENGLAKTSDYSQYQALEQFTKLINQAPPPSSLQKTPDGKANTMGISFVEAKLDEVYLRQWGAEDVNVLQLGNEVLVWLNIWVIDPQTKLRITRPGFAAVVITVDKVPDGLFGKEKNAWSLDMANKKPNAMYLAFPKAKSLAIKNAAQTLGESFGRNLNRKFEDSPEEFYGNLLNDLATLTDAKKELHQAKTNDEFKAIFAKYPELHGNDDFKKEYLYYQRKNTKS